MTCVDHQRPPGVMAIIRLGSRKRMVWDWMLCVLRCALITAPPVERDRSRQLNARCLIVACSESIIGKFRELKDYKSEAFHAMTLGGAVLPCLLPSR